MKVNEELVRENGNQAAAVMADYAAQGGGGDQPTPTPPSYTPNPRFDIDTILSGFPLNDNRKNAPSLVDSIGYPFDHDGEFIPIASNGLVFSGSYYYSGQSEDFSLPIGFNAGNYACLIALHGSLGRLYMAPVETMAYKEVALLEYDGDNGKIWNVTPVN